MARLFVVDGNWYLHRCWFTLRTNRPVEEVLPYNFLSLIMKDALAVGATHIEVAMDGSKVFRHKLFLDYKSDRKDKKEAAKEEKKNSTKKNEYKSQEQDEIYFYLPFIRELFAKVGLKFIQPPKHEADDVLCARGDQYASEDVLVILGARDKDDYQALNKRVIMYDSSFKNKAGESEPRYFTYKMAEAQKGVKIKQMIDLQTLFGDKTDSIPQLKTELQARNILNQYGSITNWYKEGSEEDRKWLKRHQVALGLNKKLVTMVTDCVATEPLEVFQVPKAQYENMPKSWYQYQEWLYPKSIGLFGRR